MKRIVIDLEMCKVPRMYRNKNYPYAAEIIQIGAVRLDENNEITDEFSSYVKPVYGAVDNFIKNLTGIRGTNVRTAQPLDAIVREMLAWIGTKDVCIISWSESDYYQLKRELCAKVLETDEFEILLDQENWVDYQKEYEERFRFGRSLSLKDALFYLEIDPVGRLHDGLADAYNTARIIAEMERNPEKMFLLDRIRKTERETEQIGTCLGSLLQGFKSQIA